MEKKKERGAFGRLLRFWRTTFKMSQEQLAWNVGVSHRHLGFLENGRAKPSKEMVLNLADALNLNIRGTNNLLLAAGFMSDKQTLSLETPELSWLRDWLNTYLRNTEGHPAFIMDRYSNIKMINKAFLRLLQDNDMQTFLQGPINASHFYFSMQGIRPYIKNWEETACIILMNLQQEVLLGNDPHGQKLLDELLDYPDIPDNWQRRAVEIVAKKTTHLYCYQWEIQFKGKTPRDYIWYIFSLGGSPYIPEPRLRLNKLIPIEGKSDYSLDELEQDDSLTHPLLFDR